MNKLALSLPELMAPKETLTFGKFELQGESIRLLQVSLGERHVFISHTDIQSLKLALCEIKKLKDKGGITHPNQHITITKVDADKNIHFRNGEQTLYLTDTHLDELISWIESDKVARILNPNYPEVPNE